MKNTASTEIPKNRTQPTGVPSNLSKAGLQSWHSAVSAAIFPATGSDNTVTANTQSKENLNIDLHTRTAVTFAVASEGTGERRGESAESTTRAALVLVDDFSSEKPEPVAAVNNQTEVWLGAGQPAVGAGFQAKQVDLGILEEGQGQTKLVGGQIGLQLVHTGQKEELETSKKGLEMEEAVPTRMESGIELEEKPGHSRRLPDRYTGPTRQPPTMPTTTARVVNHNMNLQEADTDINYIYEGT